MLRRASTLRVDLDRAANTHHIVESQLDLVDLAQKEVSWFEAGDGGSDGSQLAGFLQHLTVQARATESNP